MKPYYDTNGSDPATAPATQLGLSLTPGSSALHPEPIHFMADRALLACGEQPQARFERVGLAAMSDAELLVLMLHAGSATQELMKVAHRLIAEAGSLAALAGWEAEDFTRWKGISLAKGKQLMAMLEIGRRMMQPNEPAPLLNRPELIAQFLAPVAKGLEVEKFWVLCLDRKNRLKKLVEVTSGTATCSLAHPREVFRAAIREGATAVVCGHNHPSGDPAPSPADMQVTRQLREAGRTVDIDLMDHVIVGQARVDPTGIGHFSFRRAGLL